MQDCNCNPALHDGESKFEPKKMIETPALVMLGIGVVGTIAATKLIKKKRKSKR
jgi:hypothetical protein